MKALDKIKARLKAATPGPWEGTCVVAEGTEIRQIYGAKPGDITSGEWICTPVDRPHQDLIAHAPTDMARLIRALEYVEHWISPMPKQDVLSEINRILEGEKEGE